MPCTYSAESFFACICDLHVIDDAGILLSKKSSLNGSRKQNVCCQPNFLICFSACSTNRLNGNASAVVYAFNARAPSQKGARNNMTLQENIATEDDSLQSCQYSRLRKPAESQKIHWKRFSTPPVNLQLKRECKAPVHGTTWEASGDPSPALAYNKEERISVVIPRLGRSWQTDGRSTRNLLCAAFSVNSIH